MAQPAQMPETIPELNRGNDPRMGQGKRTWAVAPANDRLKQSFVGTIICPPNNGAGNLRAQLMPAFLWIFFIIFGLTPIYKEERKNAES